MPAAQCRDRRTRRSAPAGRAGWIARLHGIHSELTAPQWEPAPDGVNFAAVCIAVKALFASPDSLLARARALALRG